MSNIKKLTLEQEIELCNEYTNTKITEVDLAKKYGICSASIVNVRKRHNISRRPKIKNNLISCNENYFETIDSADKSYWLGFISGDGRVDQDDNSLVIGLAIKDKSHLEKFILNLESEHSIYEKHTTLKKTGKTYEGCILKVVRPKIIADLVKHGITQNKSKELSIPKTIPDELVKDFVRGIIDSDGCWSIDKKNTMNFSFLSSVYSFAEEISSYLIEHCDLHKTKISQRPGCWETHWGGNIQCEKIFKHLYSNGPWLERKYKLASEHFRAYNKISGNLVIENPKSPSELDRLLGFV